MSFWDSLKKFNLTKVGIKHFIKDKINLQKEKLESSIKESIPQAIEPIDDLDKIVAEILAEDAAMDKKLSEKELDSVIGGQNLSQVESGFFKAPGDLEDTLELFPGSTTVEGKVESSFDSDMFADEKFEEEKTTFVPKHAKPNYVFGLDTEVSADFQAAILTPQPIDAGPSILDNKIADLEAMDINKLRAQLLDEVRVLEKVNPEYRKVQLQKIFTLLLKIEPDYPLGREDNNYQTQEQRLYSDLISTPGLSSIPYVREFLENDFYVNGNNVQKKDLLVKIFDYYDTHTPEAVEKFNYIFRSSDYVAYTLFSNNLDLDTFFNNRAMEAFRKEDLSQLFRFYFNTEEKRKNLEMLFSPEHAKSLFMISQMTKKVNASIGHSSEFLEGALKMFNASYGVNSFTTLLVDVYDEFISSREDELAFEQALANNDDFILIRELINYVVLNNYDRSLPVDLFKGNTSSKDFLKAVSAYRERHHKAVFGIEGYTKILDGSFNPTTDFKAITTHDDLDYFKEAFLYNIYGISMEEALHLKEHYGRYMDVLMEGLPPKPDGMSDADYLASLDESKMTIMKKDYETLQMFRAIITIFDLNLNDPQFKDKLQVLQDAYFMQIRDKGLDHQHVAASAIVIEGLLNNMFMNTYNKRLLGISYEHRVLKVDDGVLLLDAGLEFDMILTSLSGVGDFYDNDVNMASKWNTASLSTGQGICTSHISSQNLGVISLNSPMLGFSHLPGSALNAMGANDIFTSIDRYNLRTDNDSRQGANRFFIPGNIMSNQTRYGYNEILLDRFMMQDEHGNMKLQPDYMVFYKMSDDDYKKNVIYLQTKKMAQEFGIPIMVVDIPAIKEHERSVIKGMEEELFSSPTVNHQLMEDILTRYMNNYTGSLTIINNSVCGWKYKEDFSVDGMRSFFNRVITNIGEMEDVELQRQWLDALEDAYKLERKRYKEAKSVSGWASSVTKFILDEMDIKGRIQATRYDIEHGYDLSDPDKTEELPQVVQDDPDKTEELPQIVQGDPDKTEELPQIDYEDTWEFDFGTSSIDPESLPKVKLENGDVGFFATETSFSPKSKAIVELLNYLDEGTKFEVIEGFEQFDTIGSLIICRETTDLEMMLIENLVACYLFENTDLAIVCEIDFNLKMDADFKATEGYDFNTDVMHSPFKEVLDVNGKDDYIPLNPDKVQHYIEKVQSMSDEKFLKIFSQVITNTAKKTGEPVETIAGRLLDKKANIGEVFAKLQTDVDILNGKASSNVDINEASEGPKGRGRSD